MPTPFSRRDVLAAGGGVALATLLAACGGSGSGGSDQLQLWQAFTSKELEQYFTKHFVDAYNAEHDLGVELSVKQIETIDRLTQTAVASGRGPDLLVTSGPASVLNYVDIGKVVALDAYAERYGWSEQVLPWALDTGRVDGKLYSLPNVYETMATFYNVATFEERGWSPPADREELEAICAEAKGRGMMPIAAGNAEWKAATDWYVSVFLNYACGPGNVHRALGGELPWTDPVFVDGVELLNRYFQRGWFGGSVENYFTNKTGTLHQKLATGEAALELSGTWLLQELPAYFGEAAGNDATWDWANLPALTQDVDPGTFILSIGGTYSINADSELADDAAAYLDFVLSDPERYGTAMAEVGFQPPPIRLTDAAFPAGVDERQKRLYTSLTAATSVGYATWTFWPPKSNSYLYLEMEKVITGQVTPREYCEGLDEVFKEELAAGKVPPAPSPTPEG